MKLEDVPDNTLNANLLKYFLGEDINSIDVDQNYFTIKKVTSLWEVLCRTYGYDIATKTIF